MGVWNGNQITPFTAPPIPVAIGATVLNVNATLAIGAYFRGAVANDAGAPIQNASIDVYDARGNYVARAYSNSTGVYTTTPGLPAGAYRLRFNGTSIYTTVYFDNQHALETATVVTVSAGITESVVPTVILARGGVITGRVFDTATGQAVRNTYVSAFGQTSGGSGYGYLDSSGYYTIAGLPSDVYQMNTSADFSDLPYPYTAGGRSVTVTAPLTTTAIDFALSRGGAITGRVIDVGRCRS